MVCTEQIRKCCERFWPAAALDHSCIFSFFACASNRQLQHQCRKSGPVSSYSRAPNCRVYKLLETKKFCCRHKVPLGLMTTAVPRPGRSCSKFRTSADHDRYGPTMPVERAGRRGKTISICGCCSSAFDFADDKGSVLAPEPDLCCSEFP
jgi:hypothetical protein